MEAGRAPQPFSARRSERDRPTTRLLDMMRVPGAQVRGWPIVVDHELARQADEDAVVFKTNRNSMSLSAARDIPA